MARTELCGSLMLVCETRRVEDEPSLEVEDGDGPIKGYLVMLWRVCSDGRHLDTSETMRRLGCKRC